MPGSNGPASKSGVCPRPPCFDTPRITLKKSAQVRDTCADKLDRTENAMRIEQINTSRATGSILNFAKATSLASPGAATNFEAAKHLNQALTGTPDVRADKVARAKELLADPNYPPRELLDNISSLLANRWPDQTP